MPFIEYIKIELKSQGFEIKDLVFSANNDSSIAIVKSSKERCEAVCSFLRWKCSLIP